MYRLSLIIALLLSSAAYAQEPASFTLTVTPAELQVIGKGLGTQPYESTAPLMAKLQAQVLEQQKPKDAKAEPAK